MTSVDFFISYTAADEAWATWIARTLERAGYSTVFQKWDFRSGENFLERMDQALTNAQRVLAVTVAEPDGESGHGVRIDAKQQQAAALRAGDTAEAGLVRLEDWPEPTVPRALQAALAAAPDRIQELRKDITPMARWERVRRVNATRNPGTRQRRVEVSISKMQSGKRRPCCFQPSRVHRPGPFEEREADRSAMIGRAYAVSEPCDPWEVSQG